MERECDLVILGGGMAGFTAAIFAGRCGLSPVLLMDYVIGGQILNIEKVMDFPGFPDGIPGYELGPLVQQQAEAAGAEIVMEEVTAVATAAGARFHLETGTGSSFLAKALIVATGSALRKLGGKMSGATVPTTL